MTKNNTHSPGKDAQKITYQPFLLAIAFLAMLGKVVVSMTTGGPLIDWLFIVVVIFFVGALLVYVWDRSRVNRNKHIVSISTGKAKDSTIVGIQSDTYNLSEENVAIKTGDISNTKIAGVESKKGKTEKR